jgi:hypothetical protein
LNIQKNLLAAFFSITLFLHCDAIGIAAGQSSSMVPLVLFVGGDPATVTRTLIFAAQSPRGFRALGQADGPSHPLFFQAPIGYALDLVAGFPTGNSAFMLAHQAEQDKFAILSVNWYPGIHYQHESATYTPGGVLMAAVHRVREALPRGYKRHDFGGVTIFRSPGKPSVEILALCCQPGTPSFRLFLLVFVPGAQELRVEDLCITWESNVPQSSRSGDMSCAARWVALKRQ